VSDGGKRKKERGVGQGVCECVRGREREIKREVRDRVRGRGGDIVGRGRSMRERVERYCERGRQERVERERANDCERKGEIEGKGGR
jgi:hypothetical protein